MNSVLTNDDIILYIFFLLIGLLIVINISLLFKLINTPKKNLNKLNDNIQNDCGLDSKNKINKEVDEKVSIYQKTAILKTSNQTFENNINSSNSISIKSLYNFSDIPYSINESKNEEYEKDYVEVFYMTKPVENYFPVSAKSNNPIDTVYKFKVDINKTNATYEVHSLGAPIKEIIKRSEIYLVPACVEDNISSIECYAIRTLKYGRVKLENNKWLIIKKALIRYE